MSRAQSSRHVIKSFQKKAEARRTLSERIADTLTSSAGSMSFLLANLLFFIFWVAFNSNLIPGFKAFDHFPFGLLTMLVSLEAIALSIMVLISQNRQSKIEELVEEVNLQMNMISEEEISKIIELLVILLKTQNIDVSNDTLLKDMMKPTDTDKIERVLEKQIL